MPGDYLISDLLICRLRNDFSSHQISLLSIRAPVNNFLGVRLTDATQSHQFRFRCRVEIEQAAFNVTASFLSLRRRVARCRVVRRQPAAACQSDQHHYQQATKLAEPALQIDSSISVNLKITGAVVAVTLLNRMIVDFAPDFDIEAV